ncbi:MAG: hypothetical protein R3C44_21530 [Chloroflexota bacterium]
MDIAVSRGATVFPYRGSIDEAAEFAASVHATPASRDRTTGRFSLSPSSLLSIGGDLLVLPSFNGSTLSLSAGGTPVLADVCATPELSRDAARQFGRHIGLIPAGERWRADGSLRPSFEDLIGREIAYIISYLKRGCPCRRNRLPQ